MAKARTQAERGAKAIEALPSVVRVLGFDVAITRISATEGHAREMLGEFCPLHEEIRIVDALASPQRTVEVFLHELCHSIYWAAGLRGLSSPGEETVVTAFGQSLMQVFLDNPWLTRWLDEHSK